MHFLALLSLAAAVGALPSAALAREVKVTTITTTTTILPSCGLPKKTTTASAKTKRAEAVGEMATVTKTITAALSTPSAFNIYATINNMYATKYNEALQLSGERPYDPPRFAIASGNRLRYKKSLYAVQDNTTDPEDFFFFSPSVAKSSGLFDIHCNITYAGDGICPLNCVSPNMNGTVQSYGYNSIWYLGTEAIPFGSTGKDVQVFTAIVVA